MTAVDSHTDDNDFVFPSSVGSPERECPIWISPARLIRRFARIERRRAAVRHEIPLSLEFGDFNGDTLPDFVAVVRSRTPPIKRVVWFQNEGPHRPRCSPTRASFTTAPSRTRGTACLLRSATSMTTRISTCTSVRHLPARMFARTASMRWRTGGHHDSEPQFAAPVEIVEVNNPRRPAWSFRRCSRTSASAVSTRRRSRRPRPGEGLPIPQPRGHRFCGLGIWTVIPILFLQPPGRPLLAANLGSAAAPSWSPALGNNGQSALPPQGGRRSGTHEGTFGTA